MSKIYFITGASSGFGRSLAEAVLARGDRAIIGARRLETLQAIAAAHPESALAVRLDVTDAASIQEAVRAGLAKFGRVDVLANIAGRGSLGAAEEFSVDELRQQLEVNFVGAVEMTRALLPTMRAQRSGHVLNLTSIGGLIAVGGFGPYCAAKFALNAWSEALRDEVRPFGIKVTIVEPGAFRTEFAGSVNMRPEVTLEEYREVIKPVEDYLYGNDGKQPGDPAKAALAMIEAVESEAPPLHLVLGADSFQLLGQKRAAEAVEIEQWRAVGEATAHEGAAFAPIGG